MTLEEVEMFNFRNVSAGAFLLFGTTFLWMTASFVGRTPPPRGTLWTVVNAVALFAIVAFGAAAWGVYKQASWWEPVAVVSAVVGLVAILPFMLAIEDEGQLADQGVVINIAFHVVGSTVVLAVALVPVLHDWFIRRWA
jgi:hypothetical protein